MTISNENFEILNITRNEALVDADHVCFDVKTSKGAARVLEWLNGSKLERCDSHIKINELEKLAQLFDLSEKTNFMPLEDYIPLNKIFDTIDNYLEKN